LGSLVIPTVLEIGKALVTWYRTSRPARKLLGNLARQEERCRVFVRDFILPSGSNILSIEPRRGAGIVPNVVELWPDVEGRALASVFTVFGRVGKTQNVEIVRMSQDVGQWNCHVVVLGAQAGKPEDFFRLMNNVTYRVDGDEIWNNQTNQRVEREDGFGYGIILKALNPFKTDGPGVAFLIGGYGTLGTAAAGYYFREHFEQLGRDFGKDCFGVVVRASVTAGEESVERISGLDRRIS
jgi:hypothetical protein